MAPDEVNAKLESADTGDWNHIWDCWWSAALRPVEHEALPLITEAYKHTKRWQARAAQLHHITGYAQTRKEAFNLAVLALGDKSLEVRYRACGLLAYSQQKRAIAHLQPITEGADAQTAEYAVAAIRAINEKTMARFTDLDTNRRRFYFLPIQLPRRMVYPTFAAEFHAVARKWLSQLGFEPQSVFQHDAFYRRGDLWFHAYWEQWDVLWLFMLGPKSKLTRSFVGSKVHQCYQGGKLKDVSKALEAELRTAMMDETAGESKQFDHRFNRSRGPRGF